MSGTDAPLQPDRLSHPSAPLHSTETGVPPPPPTNPLPLPPLSRTGRYVLGDELGRGGMGAVLRGRDEVLSRDVAVKVLHDDLDGHADIRSRFHDEARIGGQLQHPGVVPVYDLGHLADGRPFFAMKLVKGRTLADLLHEREGPAAEQVRFLHIFHQVCQTLAYVHSKNVIHRDLKPGNIMVGPFGEVLVMDWGLAKVIGSPQQAPTDLPHALHQSVIETDRASSPDQHTQPGAIMGTYPYMAPEQAAGMIDRLDQRCDVFALGAILCEVLTGGPPYQAEDADTLRLKALTADHAEVLARLDEPPIESELAALARACLQRDPDHRPRDAAAVAEAIDRYQDSARERLEHAERERTAAQVKAKEERKRRRMTVALAMAVLAVFGTGIAAYLGILRQQDAQRHQTALIVKQTLGQAQVFQRQARELSDKPADAVPLWDTALERMAQAAEAMKNGPASGELSAEIDGLRSQLEDERQEAAKDRDMLKALDDARDLQHELKEEDFIANKNPRYFVFSSEAGPAYEKAFRKYGIDIASLKSKDAARLVLQRPIHDRLSVALDDWYFLEPKAADGRLLEVSQRADPDPLRNRVRAAIAAENIEDLAQLAGAEEAATLTPPTLVLLASVLHQRDRRPAALALLRRGQQRHRNDFWINNMLGLHTLASDAPDYQEAASCFTAAVALRPDSVIGWNNLGRALIVQGRADDAVQVLREAIRLRRDFPLSWLTLSWAYQAQHNTEQALATTEEALKEPLWRHSPLLWTQKAQVLFARGNNDDAVAILRQVVQDRPEYFEARGSLADYLTNIGRPAEALALLEERHDPRDEELPQMQLCRGHILLARGKPREALQACEKAIKLGGGDVRLAQRIGNLLLRLAQYDRAIDVLHRAVDRVPTNAAWRANLALALRLKGRTEEAAVQAGEALELDAKNALAHNERGWCNFTQRNYGAAEAAFRKAVILEPTNAVWRVNLAMALRWGRRMEEAAARAEEALHLDARNALAHNERAWCFASERNYAAAEEAFRKAISLEPTNPQLHFNLIDMLWEAGEPAKAEAAVRHAVTISPTIPVWQHLAESARSYAERKDQPAAAVRLFLVAFAADPTLADNFEMDHRFIAARAAVRAALGQGSDARKASAEERTRWQRQARDWLQADLSACRARLKMSKPEERKRLLRHLLDFKADVDLSNMHSGEAVKQFPLEEQQAWGELWAGLDAAIVAAKGSR